MFQALGRLIDRALNSGDSEIVVGSNCKFMGPRTTKLSELSPSQVEEIAAVQRREQLIAIGDRLSKGRITHAEAERMRADVK